jgi:hypothetical protein
VEATTEARLTTVVVQSCPAGWKPQTWKPTPGSAAFSIIEKLS